MRVVADTNILVSALIFPGGEPEAAYRLALEGKVELVTSRPLLAELARVLSEKFGWQPDRAQELIEQLIRLAEIVDPQKTVSEIGADPTDNRVLEAALAGHVDAIVSGDRHLLALISWRGITVRTPASFLDRRHPAVCPQVASDLSAMRPEPGSTLRSLATGIDVHRSSQ